jgi:outer membrane protein assembly factor BamB
MAQELRRIGVLAIATVLLVGGCTPSRHAGSGATAVSTSPSPTASASVDDAPTTDASATPAEIGVIAAMPRAPHALWTVALRDLVPGWSDAVDPSLGDVAATPHALPGFRGVDVGGVLVLGLGSITEDHLVGVDTTTGTVRWHVGPDGADGRRTSTCVGESPDHLVVCQGTSASGAPQIQLLDPTSGRLARTIPLAFPAVSIGVSGQLVIAHGPGQETGSNRRDGIDLSTGETAWSVVASGAVPQTDVTGDPVASTEVRGETATLSGLTYAFAIDVRTGAELDPRLTSTSSTRPDGLVSGVGPGGAPSAALSGGPLVDITDRWVGASDIWYHPASRPTPIFASASAGDSAAGQQADTLAAIDPSDGTLLWSVDSPSAVAVGVIGGGVVVRDEEHVSLLDQRTGAVRWVVPGHEVVGFDGTYLLVVRSNVPTYVVTSVDVTDGSTLWSSSTPGGRFLTAGDQLLATDDVSLTGFGR